MVKRGFDVGLFANHWGDHFTRLAKVKVIIFYIELGNLNDHHND